MSSNKQTLKTWLESVKLGDYLKKLNDIGVDDLDDLRDLDDEEIVECADVITKTMHKKRFIKKVTQLNTQVTQLGFDSHKVDKVNISDLHFNRNDEARKGDALEWNSKERQTSIDMDHYSNRMVMDNGVGDHGAGAVTMDDLTSKQRQKLVKSLGLLQSRIMTGNGISGTGRNIFEIKTSNDNYDAHFRSIKKIEHKTETVHNAQQAQLAQKGYKIDDKNFNSQVNVSYLGKELFSAGVNASIKKTENDWQNQENENDKCYFIANQPYPRGRIILNEQCLKLTNAFVKDLQKYMKGKYSEKKMHDKWGLWVDLNVVVGAKIYLSRTVELTKNKDVTKQKRDVSNQLQAQINTCVGVEIGGGFEQSDGTEKKTSNADTNKEMSDKLQVDGGEVLKIKGKDYSEWRESVMSNPMSWAVIQIDQIKNTLDWGFLDAFLEEDYADIYENEFIPFKEKVKKTNIIVESVEVDDCGQVTVDWKVIMFDDYDAKYDDDISNLNLKLKIEWIENDKLNDNNGIWNEETLDDDDNDDDDDDNDDDDDDDGFDNVRPVKFNFALAEKRKPNLDLLFKQTFFQSLGDLVLKQKSHMHIAATNDDDQDGDHSFYASSNFM